MVPASSSPPKLSSNTAHDSKETDEPVPPAQPRTRLKARSSWSTPFCPERHQVVTDQDQAVVSPKHPFAHEERRHAERPSSVGFCRRIPKLIVGRGVHERPFKVIRRQSHRYCRLTAHILIQRPDTFDPDGSEQRVTVRDHGTELLCSRRRLHEQTEIEVCGRGLAKRDPVVVSPALRVVAAIGPLVLPGERFAGKGITATQPPNVGAIDGMPSYSGAGFAFELRYLRRGEVGVAASNRVVEVHDALTVHGTTCSSPGVYVQRTVSVHGCSSTTVDSCLVQGSIT